MRDDLLHHYRSKSGKGQQLVKEQPFWIDILARKWRGNTRGLLQLDVAGSLLVANGRAGPRPCDVNGGTRHWLHQRDTLWPCGSNMLLQPFNSFGRRIFLYSHSQASTGKTRWTVYIPDTEAAFFVTRPTPLDALSPYFTAVFAQSPRRPVPPIYLLPTRLLHTW